MYTIEQSFDLFLKYKDELIKFSEQQLNEYDTRFKIIDTIFTNILGWPKSLMECEYPVGDSAADQKHVSLFADYLLESNYNKLLIEAKRTGRYFRIPKSTHRIYKSNGVISKDDDTSSFMNQARTYMVSLGTPFCVLCNGKQFLIMKKQLINLSKDIIVFRDFQDIEDNFDLFWTILSPSSNGSDFLNEILTKPEDVRRPPDFNKRILDSFRNKNEQVPSGTIRVATENYLNRFFDDLEGEQLRDCYCDPSGRFLNFATSLKDRLLPKSMQSIERLTIKDPYKTLGNFEDRYMEVLSEDKGAVFVLVGEVGAGKSTFTKHFFEEELDHNTRKQIVWIRFNFLDFTKQPEYLDQFITEEIRKELFEGNYKKLNLDVWEVKEEIYADDKERIIKGLPQRLREDPDFVEMKLYEHIEDMEKNKYEEHLRKVFKYIRIKLGKKICFVFDNTDQKPFEEQKEVLMNAFKRANSYGSIIITALRWENFFLIKDKPPFDAYQPITFRIEAPKVKDVLKKRLEASEKYP